MPNNIYSTLTKTDGIKHLEPERFCVYNLSKVIDEMIDYCYCLHLNAEKEALQQPAMQLRSNILHLILTERHYSTSYKLDGTNSSALYLNQLKRSVNEEIQTVNLSEFLEKVAEYCSEYYDELNIKVILPKKGCKDFSARYSALIETIFHIFTAIIRIGNFNLDDELVLSASFPNQNSFPTIAVEVSIEGSLLSVLGWECGLDYVYSGLLSVYLLAKENNLLFHMEQKGEKILFLLEPIDGSRLQNAVHIKAIK